MFTCNCEKYCKEREAIAKKEHLGDAKAFKQAMAKLTLEGIETKDCEVPELFVKYGLKAEEIYLIKVKEEIK